MLFLKLQVSVIQPLGKEVVIDLGLDELVGSVAVVGRSSRRYLPGG